MTIFVDVTHTLVTGASTGIQRVVRELTRRISGPDANVAAILVAARDGEFYAINARGHDELLHPATNAAAASNPADQRVGALVRVVPALFERLQGWNYNRRIRATVVASTDPTPCRPAAGDVVVLLDAFWGGSSAPRAARKARRDGARVVPVIYDMIPVTHADLMEPATVAVFGRRVRRMLRHADGIVTISEACTATVRQFLGGRSPPITHFYLGGDFIATPPPRTSAGRPRQFVVIGTVEPRKGHALILDCFDQLWAQGEDVELIFVGRVGWADPALMARCRDHPERNRRFHHHADASDAQLATFVTAADATIVASTVEGFGLPLIESLVRGVPVIASDIPVFREIGGDAALYFAVGDAAALLQAVIEFRADPAPWRARAAAFHWIDWNTSALRFTAAVGAVLGKPLLAN